MTSRRSRTGAALAPSPRPGLKTILDGLYEAYGIEAAGGGGREPDPSTSLEPRDPDPLVDPIQIVRRYPDPADREVVGFCAAGLAFGRVASVMQSVERVVLEMGPAPAAFVRRFEPDRDGRPFVSLGHRWTRGPDLVALLWVLRQMLDRCGSIESFFLEGYDASAEDVRGALESFSTRARRLDLSRAYGRVPARPGVAYFFPRPSDGSACKRLNLYLRWMVRHDLVDLGVWSGVSPSKLIVPLDVHVIRLGRCLGLTRLASPGWRMAAEITAALRMLDPTDPTRYDFALCHAGMRDQCGFGRGFSDSRCPLRGFCRPAARRRRASPRPSGRR
jgi:uncharacterized protein (TIGR02757 family)